MKHFIYIEDTEGGSEHYYLFTEAEDIDSMKRDLNTQFYFIRGWLQQTEDTVLLDVATEMVPGDFIEHRLGILFCTNGKESIKNGSE